MGRFALFLCGIAIGLACNNAATGGNARRNGVITFGPNLTETVFALGKGDAISGVTDFCDYPPEATAKMRVGGYLDPNLEAIVALSPKLIILPGKMEKLSRLAEQNHYGVLSVHMDDLKSIHDGIRTIGAALDCTPQAEALCATIDRDLDTVRHAVGEVPRPRVLIINTRQGHDLNSLFTVGRLSFVAELAGVAGGENIFDDVDKPYFEASKESVVVRAPEVIVEFHAGEKLSAEEQARYIADWNELETVPAVQNRRIYLFLDSYGLRPGPRIGLTAKRLAEMLHPGISISLP